MFNAKHAKVDIERPRLDREITQESAKIAKLSAEFQHFDSVQRALDSKHLLGSTEGLELHLSRLVALPADFDQQRDVRFTDLVALVEMSTNAGLNVSYLG